MGKAIRWGVLGYARIARLFVIPAIKEAYNSEFYAIASRDEEKLKQCQEEFNCSKTYTNYEKLLDDPDVDAVYIPLPNSMHKEWTIKAAQKGKHILCEKPLALTAQEAEDMFDACERYHVKLMEAFMYKFTDRTKKAKEILESGILGDLKYIGATFRFFLNRENTIKMEPHLGGGSLYDVGCYPVNFLGMVTGKSPVSMVADSIKKDGVDVSFSAILKYDNGVIANINSGFNSFGKNFCEVIGTKGILEIPDATLGNAGTLTLITDEGKKEIPVAESHRYRLEVEHFADAIINNTEPLIDRDESIRNMKIIEQLLNLIK